MHNPVSKNLRKLSMATLALLPLLAWYALPLPTSLGTTVMLLLSLYTIVKNNFKINVFPKTFWLVFGYVCVMWIYHNGFATWTIFPPGGWVFFTFFLALIWGTLTFDLQFLKKYMLWIILFSAALFWIQFFLKLVYGHNEISFVPNLTGSFTYEGMSYSQLVAKQLSEDRPCSIFMEPSHMAYYYIAYLSFIWFKEYSNKWFSKKIVLIVLTLVALKSGSGMIGLTILCSVKFYRYYVTANLKQKIYIAIIILPIISGLVYLYSQSSSGKEIFSRSAEFSTEGSSGYARVISGFVMFDQLDFKQKLIGIGDPKDKFASLRVIDGSEHLYANGFQIILLSLGYIGALLYLHFYANMFCKVNQISRISILVLFVMSLLESNYLNSYMILFTIIPCADYYKTFTSKQKNIGKHQNLYNI